MTGLRKMSLQTGVVRKCLVRLQGRYKDAILNTGLVARTRGCHREQEIVRNCWTKILHGKTRRQLNRGSSENVPFKKFKRLHLCIRKHYAIIDELSDGKKPSEKEKVLYCIMSSIPPAQNNEKTFYSWTYKTLISLERNMKKVCIYIVEPCIYIMWNMCLFTTVNLSLRCGMGSKNW